MLLIYLFLLRHLRRRRLLLRRSGKIAGGLYGHFKLTITPTGFDFTAADMARYMGDFASHGLFNIAGGCCGNTPEHIAAIARALANQPPRELPDRYYGKFNFEPHVAERPATVFPAASTFPASSAASAASSAASDHSSAARRLW